MKFESFIPDILSTLIGGGLLTLLFFILREKVYKTIDLDGTWTYDQKTLMSAYNPYKGLTVRFLILLSCHGNTIYGSAEKIYERTEDGKEREYIGKNRILAKINGHIEKRYLSKDRICLHITEFGEVRESTSFQILESLDQNTLSGRFSSTIANQQGSVQWKRLSS